MAKEKAIRDRYAIHLNGQAVQVNRQVYCVWYGAERQERYQQERDRHYGVFPMGCMGDGRTDILEVLPAAGDTPQTATEKRETHDRLLTALRSLSKRERKLIWQIYVGELPRTRIAKEEGVCESAIRKRERRALGDLKKNFQKTEKTGANGPDFSDRR